MPNMIAFSVEERLGKQKHVILYNHWGNGNVVLGRHENNLQMSWWMQDQK